MQQELYSKLQIKQTSRINFGPLINSVPNVPMQTNFTDMFFPYAFNTPPISVSVDCKISYVSGPGSSPIHRKALCNFVCAVFIDPNVINPFQKVSEHSDPCLSLLSFVIVLYSFTTECSMDHLLTEKALSQSCLTEVKQGILEQCSYSEDYILG